MPGIIPNQGVTYRDAAGNCIAQPSVENAYCPAPEFAASCPLVALPDDCTARLDPGQINALVSEIIAFAEALCPEGPWDCDSSTNLAAIWESGCWLPDDLNLCASPIVNLDQSILFVGCDASGPVRFQFDPCVWATDIAACVVSDDDDNQFSVGSDGLLYYNFCHHNQAAAACLISADVGNGLVQGTDGLLFSSAGEVVEVSCENGEAVITSGTDTVRLVPSITEIVDVRPYMAWSVDGPMDNTNVNIVIDESVQTLNIPNDGSCPKRVELTYLTSYGLRVGGGVSPTPGPFDRITIQPQISFDNGTTWGNWSEYGGEMTFPAHGGGETEMWRTMLIDVPAGGSTVQVRQFLRIGTLFDENSIMELARTAFSARTYGLSCC